MSPPVAIIVFVHSEKDACLDKTLESILQQTYRDFILYVCCRAFIADVSGLVEAYIGKHPTVYLSDYIEDSALSSAIEATETQYFGWLDSGDILLPRALERAINTIHAKPDIGVVYTKYSEIDADGLLEECAAVLNKPYSEKRFLTDFIVTQFRLIRRDIYDKVGGINNRLPYCRDYDLILKLSEVSEFLHINELLFHQRKIERDISYEKQIERVLWAREIAEQSLRRRGMTGEYALDAELLPRCYLIDRVPSEKGTIQ